MTEESRNLSDLSEAEILATIRSSIRQLDDLLAELLRRGPEPVSKSEPLTKTEKAMIGYWEGRDRSHWSGD